MVRCLSVSCWLGKKGCLSPCPLFFLELDRASVSQRGVFPEPVVEDLDVFEGVASGFGVALEDMVPHGGCLVSSVERFHRRVVVAVALGGA